MKAGFKQRLGCWGHERWRAEVILRAPGLARRLGLRWQDLCNRNERLARSGADARECLWACSSALTVCRLFPEVGGRLIHHIQCEHPFHLEPQKPPAPVSVIIPVRGIDRKESLAFVVSSLVASSGSESEVLVCEHDNQPKLQRDWPSGVRHVFVPARKDEAFNKSKAMNAGALAARHAILLFHDADVWPSADYVATCVSRMLAGHYEAVHPIRFLFMLDPERTRYVIRKGSLGEVARLAHAQQNNPGLSNFIVRDAYYRIGGHDERFVSWGWEDVEFMDRMKTCAMHPGAFLPAVHLWHAASLRKRIEHSNRDLLARVRREALPVRMEVGRLQLDRNGWTYSTGSREKPADEKEGMER